MAYGATHNHRDIEADEVKAKQSKQSSLYWILY